MKERIQLVAEPSSVDAYTRPRNGAALNIRTEYLLANMRTVLLKSHTCDLLGHARYISKRGSKPIRICAISFKMVT